MAGGRPGNTRSTFSGSGFPVQADPEQHRAHLEGDFAEIDGMEQHTLTSVGIDIGSSTSQLVVSRLTMRRRGSALSTEFVVTDRELLYVSRPILTPYCSGTSMDIRAIEQFVNASYDAAQLRPDCIDTGVVVITGEALNKDNAQEIGAVVASWSGDFVCVSAGANHEAVLAAHGSGAVKLSELEGHTVLNVDIGGGTTKVSLIRNGELLSREAFSAGARLISWDAQGRITRLEAPAHLYADNVGLTLDLGQRLRPEDVDGLAEIMARVVLDAIVPGPISSLRRRLMVTDTFPEPPAERRFDRIVFSGGVSEYIEDRESTSYGDLGPALGAHICRQLEAAGLAELIVTADQGIRATVIGASQFSVQASGQTCYISDGGSLPVRNLPVTRLVLADDDDPGRSIERALRTRDRTDLSEPIALALHFQGLRSYAALRSYADALVRSAAGQPLYLVLRDDLAQSMGYLVVVEAKHPGPAIVIDGITVGDLDHIDIGQPMGATHSIPVTIKSLAFPHDELPPYSTISS
jgi:ethanolamine utilization protein EutA